MKQTFSAFMGSLLLLMSSIGRAADDGSSEDVNKQDAKPAIKSAVEPAKRKAKPKPESNSETGDANTSNSNAAPNPQDQNYPSAKGPSAGPLKPAVKGPVSKALDGRFSLGTSVGWAVIKPRKGDWSGLGMADVNARWRTSAKTDGNLYYTGRYAPYSGVWTVDKRDYDTTLHGVYVGMEYQRMMRSVTLKAGVELGYMLVYAKPQDNSPASGEVKGSTVNATAGGGADWSFISDKVKIGPFARVHLAGFNVLNVGGSVQFVF
jgi:hypothetical protein